MLLYAHVMNGDFYKNVYLQPSSSELKSEKAPLNFYRSGIFLYELGVHLAMTVALAFWLVELPALALDNQIFEWNTQRWFELIFSHTLP